MNYLFLEFFNSETADTEVPLYTLNTCTDIFSYLLMNWTLNVSIKNSVTA